MLNNRHLAYYPNEGEEKESVEFMKWYKPNVNVYSEKNREEVLQQYEIELEHGAVQKQQHL